MEPTIEEIQAQPIVGIRVQTTMSQIGDHIGQCLGRIAPFIGDRAAGPPISRYHTWDGEGGEMEVAMPVSAPMEGEGDIQGGELPACRAAVVVHTGPYEGLHAVWQNLGAWIKENGHEGGAAPWEVYMNDPGTLPPEQWQTRIVWPIP